MGDELDSTVEEVRFAVVLNGGIGLAAWMGGVVIELDRLTRAHNGYCQLCELVGGRARVDVISGTSAGGVNAAALALAQVNRRSDLTILRDLWFEHGRMDKLLRTPFKGSPVSLLQGDEYFLPRIEDTMRRLTAQFDPFDVDYRPMDLRITATLLRDRPKITSDALGQRIAQGSHRGIFRFVRDAARDDFIGGSARVGHEGIGTVAVEELCRRLALAARSSASTPLAFEPSFVPVDGSGSAADMSPIASWAVPGTDRSRFVVDGGILMNTPTKDVLEAIENMPAEGPTRRIVWLVFPNAVAATVPYADARGEPPSLAGTFGAIVRAQASQSNRAVVEEIAAHNRGVITRRSGRDAVLENLSRHPDMVNRMYTLTANLYSHYADLRIRRAGRTLAEKHVLARAQHAIMDVDFAESWSFDRIQRLFQQAHRSWYDSVGSLPYVPGAPPPESTATLLAQPGWPWDVATAERLAVAALDLFNRLAWALPARPGMSTVREGMRVVHRARSQLHAMNVRLRAGWEHMVIGRPDPEYWLDRLRDYSRVMTGEVGEQIKSVVVSVAEAVDAAARVLLNEGDIDWIARDPGLLPWLQLLRERPTDVDADLQPLLRRVSRLLALEIATTCLAENSESPQEQLLDVVQVSLQTMNPFTSYSNTPEEKAGGYTLSRLSGFLQRSGRASDWIWGRLDAATNLCRTMLDPARIRRAAELNGSLSQGAPRELAEQIVCGLVEDLFGGTPHDSRIKACIVQAIEELTEAFAAAPGDTLQASYPGLTTLFSWALHVGIILDELPELRRAVEADLLDGANVASPATQFLQVNRALIAQIEMVPPGASLDPSSVELGLRALEAFDRAGIGREPVRPQTPSDQVIRTVATAAATAVTAVDSEGFGMSVARPLTRMLRGFVLLPYWIVTSLTSGGRVARLLAQFGLLAGGLLVLLALFGVLPSWAREPGATLGGAMLLTVFGYSALRTGSLIHGLVILSPVVPIAAHTFVALKPRTGLNPGVVGLLVVAGFALLLLVLGSLPNERRSPLRGIQNAILSLPSWIWRGRVWPLVGVVAVGVGALIVRTPILATLDRYPRLVLVGLGVVVVLAAVVAYLGGRSLRIWHRLPGGWVAPPTRDQAASTAGWAVVYGFCYVVIAIGVAPQASGTPLGSRWWVEAPPWARTAMGTAILFAAVLLLIVPWIVPHRARQTVRRFLVAEANPGRYPDGEISNALLMRLGTHGLLQRSLVRPVGGEDFQLTRAGRRLARRLARESRRMRAPEMSRR